jgi:putative tricarboxylic transport membrane protein
MTFVYSPVSAALLLVAAVIIALAVLPSIRRQREEVFQE